jgi:DNA mismatch repair protein MutS
MDTPMMRQYEAVKRAHPGALVMFRLGDFYELFGEDAEVAARALDLVLTSRPVAKGRRIPMCGVPHHAADGYVAKLLDRGFRVAICDQVEDAKLARGLVRREVVRVVTPGTAMSPVMLAARETLYAAALCRAGGRVGFAVADVSTGEFRMAERTDEAGLIRDLQRYAPREVIVAEDADPTLAALAAPALVTPYDSWRFGPDAAERALRDHFQTPTLDGFGCADAPVATRAAGALLQYLRETQRSALPHIWRLQTDLAEDAVTLDPAALRSLEITAAMGGDRHATLVAVVDRTQTAMGARCLHRWLRAPLGRRAEIEARHDAVEALCADGARRRLQDGLSRVADLERLVGRAGHGSANARDLAAIARSLAEVDALRHGAAGLGAPLLHALAGDMDTHAGLRDAIAGAFVEDPPASVRDGGFIRRGYDPELDALRDAARSGKAWIADLEASERERTGIKSLRVGYNKVFGYYVEIRHANRDRVPPEYERRQTLVGAERYVTPAMKEREALILSAQERIAEREHAIFAALRDRVAAASATLLRTAAALAALDVLAGFAEVARAHAYVRPEMTEDPVLTLAESRHPVVERLVADERFVPNDLDVTASRRVAVVTGPNFGGKSTYLRQAALAVVLAQAGSFVPARRARIGVVDRIFTRVGAQDDLAGGRSTFLVEMQETANILHNATPRSLVILDEVGRGTSTYDGLSLAWAVVERLHDETGCRALFATHYQELTELAERLPGVFNLNVLVREEGDRVVFTHRVAEGAADRSYGLHVAQLAGLPPDVISRAGEILARLQAEKAEAAAALDPDQSEQLVLGIEAPPDWEREIAALDLASMTPLDAMNALAEIQSRLRAAARAAPTQSPNVIRLRRQRPRASRDG